MNKTELVVAVRKEIGKDACKAGAERALNAVLRSIYKGLHEDGQVKIVDFGKFRVSKRRARLGRNPKTGAQVQVKASNTVRFSAGQSLKEGL
jgi:DNA-binding protein HU-beta